MRKILLMCCAAVALSAGCSKQEQQKVEEPSMVPAARPVAKSAPEAPETANVYIDRRILELCAIPVPHFPFDSSALSAQAEDALTRLAECFVSGPGADKRLSLVGHADPRGTEEYNLALGQRRAASVARSLEGKGLASARMETSSRGELDATGTDETSFAEDRRVGIFLAE